MWCYRNYFAGTEIADVEHKSQFATMGARVGSDLREVIELPGRFRGLQAGVKYAEAFRSLRTGLRILPKRLLP